VQNAAAALAVLQRLKDRIPVDQRAVRAGLLSARLAGRFDVRPGTPTLVIDVAHNPQAARALADNLRRLPRQGRLLAVFGALDDKDVEGVVRPLSGCVDHWYLGSIEDDRGLDADALVDRAAGILVGATRFGSVVEAFDAAVAAAAEQDVVVVFGSFMVAGVVLRDRLGGIDDAGSND
jgi:dihydrofolate synthase/folylpolyglutamate synthase